MKPENSIKYEWDQDYLYQIAIAGQPVYRFAIRPSRYSSYDRESWDLQSAASQGWLMEATARQEAQKVLSISLMPEASQEAIARLDQTVQTVWQQVELEVSGKKVYQQIDLGV